jgi:peptide-methionine (R)-S-oxide reductase
MKANWSIVVLAIAGVVVVLGCAWLFFGAGAKPVVAQDAGPGVEKHMLTGDEWRKRLSPEQFAVLREEATERRGSSPLNREKRRGVFVCAGCGLELFRSETKFESGTGWPSFYDVIPGHVETKIDHHLLVLRTEYHCARCGGHQGHVFDDGPPPTGLRYCNNGVALDFIPAE